MRSAGSGVSVTPAANTGVSVGSDGVPVGFGVGLGVGFGVGLGVGFGVGLGVGFGVGFGVVLGLAVGQTTDGTVLMVSAASLVIKAVSVYFLLQPEAGDWFRRRP